MEIENQSLHNITQIVSSQNMYIRIYIHTYIHIHIYIYTHMHIYPRIHTYTEPLCCLIWAVETFVCE